MVESLTFSVQRLQRGQLSLENNGQNNFIENDGRLYHFLLCLTKQSKNTSKLVIKMYCQLNVIGQCARGQKYMKVISQNIIWGRGEYYFSIFQSAIFILLLF